MKLATESGALADAVRFAARALTARIAYPILSGLKITADAGGTWKCRHSTTKPPRRPAPPPR